MKKIGKIKKQNSKIYTVFVEPTTRRKGPRHVVSSHTLRDPLVQPATVTPSKLLASPSNTNPDTTTRWQACLRSSASSVCPCSCFLNLRFVPCQSANFACLAFLCFRWQWSPLSSWWTPQWCGAVSFCACRLADALTRCRPLCLFASAFWFSVSNVFERLFLCLSVRLCVLPHRLFNCCCCSW